MHEVGIAQQVIDACEVHLRRQGATHATAVGLRVGALASVDPDALRFCFDSLKTGTALASATVLPCSAWAQQSEAAIRGRVSATPTARAWAELRSA